MGLTVIHLFAIIIVLDYAHEIYNAAATARARSNMLSSNTNPNRKGIKIKLVPTQIFGQQIGKMFANVNSNKKQPKRIKIQLRNQTSRDHIIRCCGRRTCRQPFQQRKKMSNKINIRTPSYKNVIIEGQTYMIPPEKESYGDAKKECEKQGMAIATMDGKKEKNDVSDYLSYLGLESDVVFSALGALAGPGSAFDGWGKEPLPPGDCTATYDNAMYNTSCDTKSHFICEKPPYTGPPTPPPGLSGLLPIDDAPLIFAGGKSYLVPSEQATVPVATNMCADKGMELMSLESLAETSVVQDFLGDLGLSTNTMLTSLKKLSGGDEFNWLGGVAASVMNWAPNEPAPGAGSECASLNSLGLSGITCDTVANFVCEAPGPSVIAEQQQQTTVPQAPEAATLPQETSPAETTTLDPISRLLAIAEAVPVTLGDSQYIVPSEKANYVDAQGLCGTRDMGLVSLEALAENDVVQDYLGSLGLSSHSMLTSLKKTGLDSFDWFGGFAAESLQWGAEPSAVESGKDCAGLSAIGLSPVSCDEISHFVCESKPPTTPAPVTQTTLKVGLVNAKINGRVYFLSEETLPYSDAKAVCDIRGQNMLSIDDLLEHMSIVEGIRQAGLMDLQFYTSLKKNFTESDDGVQEFFNWGNGKVLVVEDIEYTQPLSFDLECAAYVSAAIKFGDCTTPRNFICEESTSATTPPPSA